MTSNGDGMKLFKVAERRWAAFTKDGDYIDTLDYEDAKPLILRPEARRQFLTEHGIEAPGIATQTPEA